MGRRREHRRARDCCWRTTSATEPDVEVGSVSMVLLINGHFACWLPARRAARVDPVTTLRAD